MFIGNQDFNKWESLEWDILEKVEVCENILLTGAGFTRDFGGFLAEEIWAHIYNHPAVRACPKVAQKMLSDFNYESIFNAILKSNEYDNTEKQAIRDSVLEAYINIEDEISNPANLNGASLSGLKSMIHRFKGDQEQAGFIFTLNQDLFMERHCLPVNRPWVNPLNIGNAKIDPARHFDKLPNEIELADLMRNRPLKAGSLYYIKLHGSINWKGSDNESRMVIGLDKEDQIAREPLLRVYVNLFKMVISRAKRLLVIGYSFGDEHINRIIAVAMAECHNPDLELYVISAESPSDFMASLKYTYAKEDKCLPHGQYFLDNGKIKGYFPYRISQIFPPTDNSTQKWKMIQRCLWSA